MCVYVFLSIYSPGPMIDPQQTSWSALAGAVAAGWWNSAVPYVTLTGWQGFLSSDIGGQTRYRYVVFFLTHMTLTSEMERLRDY